MAVNSDFTKEVIDYILKNENADPYALALKKSPFPDVDMKLIARQIQGRKIAKRKFPFLLDVHQYRYPKKESLEQASSERTGTFKSKIMKGNSFVDLTGGMGIDTYLLGKAFQNCTYIEPNQELCDTTTQNFKHLGFNHVNTLNCTCEDFLQSNINRHDWAYIDPSRRIDGSRKTSIHNYEPNLVELQQKINKITDNLLVKLSPMQDISECIDALDNVHKIWVISIQNEVKELLLHIKEDADTSPIISAIDLNKGDEVEFSYPFESRVCNVENSAIKTYLYQPSSAIIKSELQNVYASRLGLEKLNANTQLYTSEKKNENFMGRIFLVKESINLNKKAIKKALPLMKANVITKNLPLSPQALVQKYKLKEGGAEYLIAYTDHLKQVRAAICSRIK